MSSSAHIDVAYEEFLCSYPEYQATTSLDELRRREYGRLEEEGHVYLDYTGGGLYAMSQVRAHHELLARRVFGNPHSSNPTSMAMTELVEGARQSILRYFNASPEEYVAIFTANASHALKLVGESYPFEAGDHYLLTFDNHNSVNGIREFARARRHQRLCASGVARYEYRRGPVAGRPGPGATGQTQPLCLPCAVELLGGAAFA